MDSGELPDWLDLEVERLRGTVIEDTHGSSITDWSSPSRLVIEGCWIGTPGGTEFVLGRQTVINEQWWWGPQDADVLSTDRLRNADSDITYEIDGPILPEPDLDGEFSHKRCKLKAVTE